MSNQQELIRKIRNWPFRTRFDGHYSVTFLGGKNYFPVFQIKLCSGWEIEGRSEKGSCTLQIDYRLWNQGPRTLGFFCFY